MKRNRAEDIVGHIRQHAHEARLALNTAVWLDDGSGYRSADDLSEIPGEAVEAYRNIKRALKHCREFIAEYKAKVQPTTADPAAHCPLAYPMPTEPADLGECKFACTMGGFAVCEPSMYTTCSLNDYLKCCTRKGCVCRAPNRPAVTAAEAPSEGVQDASHADCLSATKPTNPCLCEFSCIRSWVVTCRAHGYGRCSQNSHVKCCTYTDCDGKLPPHPDPLWAGRG